MGNKDQGTFFKREDGTIEIPVKGKEFAYIIKKYRECKSQGEMDIVFREWLLKLFPEEMESGEIRLTPNGYVGIVVVPGGR